MGNCINSNAILSVETNKFINYNIIDKKYKITVGTYLYSNKEQTNNNGSNTMISQGICIGYKNKQIHRIKFGMIHRYNNITVELYFENNIKLIFVNNKESNKIKITLVFNNLNKVIYISKEKFKKSIELIDNNSEYIDLIFNLTQ